MKRRHLNELKRVHECLIIAGEEFDAGRPITAQRCRLHARGMLRSVINQIEGALQSKPMKHERENMAENLRRWREHNDETPPATTDATTDTTNYTQPGRTR